MIVTSGTTFPPIGGDKTIEKIIYGGRVIWQRAGGTGSGPDTEPPGPDGPGAPPDPGDPPTGTFLDTVNVSNASQLSTALSTATAGDDIVLADGTYTGDFTLNVAGNATNPIRVRALNPHQAIINGTFTLAANYGRLRQLRWNNFTGGNSIIEVLGTYCVVERNQMTGCKVSNGAQRGLIRVGGSGAQSGANSQVIYNYIYNFGGRGVCLREANLASKNIRVARNHMKKSFLDGRTGPVVGCGGDNASTMAMLLEIRNNIIEYNLFENLDTATSTGTCGPQAKNSGNIFRYNTMRNAGRGDDASAVPNDPSSMRIEIRVARECVISGNYMDRCSGPLIFGDDHQVDGNWNTGNAYASGNWSAMGPARGNCSMDDTAILGAPGGQARARNCLFAGNKGLLYAGHTSNPLDIQGCYVEDHDGSIAGPNAGLLIPRAATITPATPVILTPSDVGPSYGL